MFVYEIWQNKLVSLMTSHDFIQFTINTFFTQAHGGEAFVSPPEIQ